MILKIKTEMCISDFFSTSLKWKQMKKITKLTVMFLPVMSGLNPLRNEHAQMRLPAANMFKTLQNTADKFLLFTRQVETIIIDCQVQETVQLFTLKVPSVACTDSLFKVSVHYRSVFISLQYYVGDFQMKGFKLGLYYLRHLLSLTLEKEVNNCVLLW